MQLQGLIFVHLVHFISFISCIPVNFLSLKNLTSFPNGDPDLSPLIYHIPGTSNSLYIRPYNYPLPSHDFGIALWRVKVYVADKIAAAKGRTNVPLPPDQDPGIYGLESPVQISWQSYPGATLTWGILAAAMRGLDDCLVKNNHLPYVAVWHVFNSDYEEEVGWGTIETGKTRVRGRPGAIA